MIVTRGYRCTTFRDRERDGSGPFAIIRCDMCGVEAEMVPKDERTLTSPPGWQDDGPRDICPQCTPSRHTGALS
jgi:hypothetical protein